MDPTGGAGCWIIMAIAVFAIILGGMWIFGPPILATIASFIFAGFAIGGVGLIIYVFSNARYT